MKLFVCRSCGDLVRIYSDWRACGCSRSSGRYVDDREAEFSGPCVVLGIDNKQFGALMRGDAVSALLFENERNNPNVYRVKR